MEKIFELEDLEEEATNSPENDQLVQQTPQSQTNTRLVQNTQTNDTREISHETSSTPSNNVSAQSVAIDDTSSASGSGSITQGTSRVQSSMYNINSCHLLKPVFVQLF